MAPDQAVLLLLVPKEDRLDAIERVAISNDMGNQMIVLFPVLRKSGLFAAEQ